MFLGKGVLKICSKFTGEHPCRSVISIKLLCNFIEITLRHGCFPVMLLHIFRTHIYKNTSEGLLLVLAFFLSQMKSHLNIVKHKLTPFKDLCKFPLNNYFIQKLANTILHQFSSKTVAFECYDKSFDFTLKVLKTRV